MKKQTTTAPTPTPELQVVADKTSPGALMTLTDAKDEAVVQAFGIVRSQGGYSLVRLKVQGERVLESTWSEPDRVAAVFDEFKKAAAIKFQLNEPPEARWPEETP